MVNDTPRPLHNQERDPVPICRKLNGSQGRSGQVQTILLPQGFDPPTVQPLVSRYYRLPFLGPYFNYIIITSYILILSVLEIIGSEVKDVAALSLHKDH